VIDKWCSYAASKIDDEGLLSVTVALPGDVDSLVINASTSQLLFQLDRPYRSLECGAFCRSLRRVLGGNRRMSSITESHVEEAALAWLTELGYGVKAGPEIAPDSSAPERPSYDDVVLTKRLERAVARLNPSIPEEARCDALRRIKQVEYPGLIEETACTASWSRVFRSSFMAMMA
jgi:hypothetical protein